jgi:hypothetical protein
MNRRLRALGGAAVVAAAIAGSAATGVAAPSDGSHGGHGGHSSHDEHRIARGDLRRLLAATAPFRRVDRALASGRVDLGLCFDQMGQHYADPATFDDGVLDPTDPEALVYENVGNRLRLVAVEWVSTEPGEVLGIPLHLNENLGVWVLHAWIWKHNPDGQLADFNPRVGDCPA